MEALAICLWAYHMAADASLPPLYGTPAAAPNDQATTSLGTDAVVPPAVLAAQQLHESAPTPANA